MLRLGTKVRENRSRSSLAGGVLPVQIDPRPGCARLHVDVTMLGSWHRAHENHAEDRRIDAHPLPPAEACSLVEEWLALPNVRILQPGPQA